MRRKVHIPLVGAVHFPGGMSDQQVAEASDRLHTNARSEQIQKFMDDDPTIQELEPGARLRALSSVVSAAVKHPKLADAIDRGIAAVNGAPTPDDHQALLSRAVGRGQHDLVKTRSGATIAIPKAGVNVDQGSPLSVIALSHDMPEEDREELLAHATLGTKGYLQKVINDKKSDSIRHRNVAGYGSTTSDE